MPMSCYSPMNCVGIYLSKFQKSLKQLKGETSNHHWAQKYRQHSPTNLKKIAWHA